MLPGPAAGGGLRPPPRVPRPRPRPGPQRRRAGAAVQPAPLVVGRLRPSGDLDRRRRLPPHGEVDPAVARGAGRARRRRRGAPARRPHQGGPAGPGRPAVERRHRHLRQGVDRDPRRGRRPRRHAAGPDRVRPGRRARQHRRHRQLGRGRLLRPRGQHQDPPRHRGGRRRDDRPPAGPAPGRDDRRGGGHGAAGQLRPDGGAGHRPGPGGADGRRPRPLPPQIGERGEP